MVATLIIEIISKVVDRIVARLDSYAKARVIGHFQSARQVEGKIQQPGLEEATVVADVESFLIALDAEIELVNYVRTDCPGGAGVGDVGIRDLPDRLFLRKNAWQNRPAKAPRIHVPVIGVGDA